MDISNTLNYDPHDEWRATDPSIHICYCSLCNHSNSTNSQTVTSSPSYPSLLSLKQVKKDIRRLFLRTLLHILEEFPCSPSQQIWQFFTEDIKSTNYFESERQVYSAWHFAFDCMPDSHFRCLTNAETDVIERMLSNEELSH